MASTPADICNIALLRVGHRQLIDDLDEDTEEAQHCNALYNHTRDAVLSRMAWGFATRRATLALVADTTRTGWEYAYALPADFLTARYLYAGVRNPDVDARVPYVLEYDNDLAARLLVTDQADAELIYTARITSVPLFPPLFVDALAWKLAAELALSLAVKPDVGMAMEQKFQLALATAAASDFNQNRGDIPTDSEFIRIR